MLTRIPGHRAAALAIALSAQCGTSFAQQVIVPDLPPEYGSTSFGMSLASSGGDLFIGAPSGQGFVERFRRVDGVWTSVQRLVAPGTQRFGSHLAVEGEWLAASAQDAACQPGACSYIIKMFRRIGDKWILIQTLDAPAAPGFVMRHIDLSSESLIVSMSRDEFWGTAEVRLFTCRRQDQSWNVAQPLIPPYPSNLFGRSFAAEGDTLVTADPHATAFGGAGAVSTFKWIDGTWVHRFGFSGPPLPYTTGLALALCGDRLFVNAYGPDGPPGWISVYRPTAQSPGWVQEGDDLLPLTSWSLAYGRDGLACSGSSVVARGEPRNGVDAYAATAEGFATHLTTPDLRTEWATVVVVGGDVVISNPYGPGPGAYWHGKVTVFPNAIDPVFQGRFD